MSKRVDMVWKRESYSLRLFELSDKLTLSETKNQYINRDVGNTSLSRNEVENLKDWLESIGFKN